ncbi:hypothetical protein [Mesorhizobium captivum]|uniref:hypothetical protein n=1 Tax=Mesorhizobium captivum TaxID=3072319 RepID=UPI002A245297|nr:hypothetical protein [Mesorhizobium sp. VK3C]MDX8449935.1 hypothetical protein [Mesorhizobium sp. VK3C]
MLDEDCGVGINLALCSRIRLAQQRVAEAKARLAKIDPASIDRSAALAMLDELWSSNKSRPK